MLTDRRHRVYAFTKRKKRTQALRSFLPHSPYCYNTLKLEVSLVKVLISGSAKQLRSLACC
jgi:hypothetical protein